MSFNASVPNASKSPALFPPQNINNMTRIQANFNAEHNFLDGAAAAQGIHRQCTFINKSAAVSSLPAGNGVLYAKNDSFSTSQLYWYNGSTTEQITPATLTLSGHSTVAGSGFLTIFPDPGYEYQAYVFASIYQTTSVVSMNVNTVAIHFNAPGSNLTVSPTETSQDFPVSFSSNDLRIKNGFLSSRVICWTLQIIRIR